MQLALQPTARVKGSQTSLKDLLAMQQIKCSKGLSYRLSLLF